MPTYHESTMYGTKSIAPTYSALFRFEILYAAYLNIDLNTLLDLACPCGPAHDTVTDGRAPC